MNYIKSIFFVYIVMNISRQKAESVYKKLYTKYQDLISGLSQQDIDTLYLSDNAKYQWYHRFRTKIKKLEGSGKLSQDFLNIVHQQTQQQSFYESQFCKNCLRKQNQVVINKFGDRYKLHLTIHYSDRIAKRNKFRRVKFKSGDGRYTFELCQECSQFLNPDI